jgi:hypothetical protein
MSAVPKGVEDRLGCDVSRGANGNRVGGGGGGDEEQDGISNDVGDSGVDDRRLLDVAMEFSTFEVSVLAPSS